MPGNGKGAARRNGTTIYIKKSNRYPYINKRTKNKIVKTEEITCASYFLTPKQTTRNLEAEIPSSRPHCQEPSRRGRKGNQQRQEGKARRG
jgi:hypothetical protein